MTTRKCPVCGGLKWRRTSKRQKGKYGYYNIITCPTCKGTGQSKPDPAKTDKVEKETEKGKV